MLAVIGYGLVMAFALIVYASCEPGQQSIQEDWDEAVRSAEREDALVLKTTRLIQGDRGL